MGDQTKDVRLFRRIGETVPPIEAWKGVGIEDFLKTHGCTYHVAHFDVHEHESIILPDGAKRSFCSVLDYVGFTKSGECFIWEDGDENFVRVG